MKKRNIIYACSLCENSVFNYIMTLLKSPVGQQVQKYHRLIVNGLELTGRANVKVVSAPPITPQNCEKKFFSKKELKADEIEYFHLPVYNIRIIKNIMTMVSAFIRVLRMCKKTDDAVLICDILNVSVSMGALMAAKLRKKKTIGIVTDLPVFISDNKKSLSVRINNKLMNSFDAYVFLSENMKEVVSCEEKPFVVIEGQVDIKMKEMTIDRREESDKSEKKICMYAGGLNRIYGIPLLVEAFILAGVENAELHIYGSGDYEPELAEICEKNPNIKYFGVKPNEYVVREQLKATLLINPRPTDNEYVYYSFPSKNMEYMVSGVATLTTRLPSMPAEYAEYVYLINDETPEGLASDLTEILSKPEEELFELGQRAKQYVLEKKNNVIQAEKILSLADEIK